MPSELYDVAWSVVVKSKGFKKEKAWHINNSTENYSKHTQNGFDL